MPKSAPKERTYVLPPHLQVRFNVLEMAVSAAITQLLLSQTNTSMAYAIGLRHAFEEFRDQINKDVALERVEISASAVQSNRNN